MRKNILTIGLVLVLVLSISLIASAEKIQLRVSWWGNQGRHNKTLKVIEMFEEKYPNIDVQPEYTGWGGYWDKINAQIAGNNLPDVIQHVRKYVKSYVENDQLLDMTPYKESGLLNFDNVPEAAVSMGTVDGKLIGVPLGVNAPAVIYDADVLKKVGIDVPIDPDWTWQEFMDIARKVHDELGIVAADNLVRETGVSLIVWLRQHGEYLYNEEGTAIGYEDDQLFADFMKMDLELMDEGVLPGAGRRQEIFQAMENTLLANDEAAFDTNHWSNQLVALNSAAAGENNFKMTVLPETEGQSQKGMYVKPSMLFTVAKNTEHPEAAIKFINFFTHSIEANKVLNANRGIPISTKVKEALKENMDKSNKQVFDYLDLATKHSGVALPPQPAAHPEVVDLYKEIVNKVLFKQVTPLEGAKEFRERANKILADQ